MKSIEESVVTALDGTDKELYPFLPYILQDSWEMGADPNVIIQLIQKHSHDYSKLKVLDLGCGKGAVSIKVAKELGCLCHGIDAVPEFINEANKKALRYGVSHLCKFEMGDIRHKVKVLSGYNVIILGAIGQVYGDYYSTLTTLSRALAAEGIFIIDDGYIENDSGYVHPKMLKQETIHEQIKASGMKLMDEWSTDKNYIKHTDNYIFDNLKKRCLELMLRYPEKKQLFIDYIKKQEEENDVLENKIICSTMVIKKIAE